MGLAELIFIALFIVGVIFLIAAGIWLFNLILHGIVIVREARKPPHLDSGDYRLDQGREVRAEERDA
jgi:hypothetical protein